VKLTVLNVAYPLATVSRDAVGGAEQVLAALDRALVEAGHRSLVVASAGSQVRGRLIETPAETGLLDEAAKARAQARHRLAIVETLKRYPVDVVHLHGIDFEAYMPAHVPTLVTLHLPLDWYRPAAPQPKRPDLWLCPVSANQAARAPEGSQLHPPIPNGVDVRSFSSPHAKRDFALLLSRICPEKGIHLGLDAAQAASMPLLIGGQVYPYGSHQRYFDDEVAPRLDARRRFLGPLGLERKRRLLGAARCLLVPSLAAETSSLVAMEALAAGTPVVAFPNGALADIIEEARTGFLVRDVGEMARAMRATSKLDPQDCRRAAQERFSLDRMISGYFEAYQQLAALGRPANRAAS